MERKLRVMLTTEGTFPFHQGGVSTWSNTLVSNLDEVEYIVYSVIMNPFVTQKFSLPDDASLIKLPLWGTEEPGEHLESPFSKVYEAKNRTTEKIIVSKFLPLFESLIRGILNENRNFDEMGKILVDLYYYFQVYEYKESFKSQVTWEMYKSILKEYLYSPQSSSPSANLFSTIQSLGWIYRFMNILNTPIPKVDVCHSSAAAFCGIPGVLSKLINHSGFLLTEHGVYIREQYLSLVQRNYPTFLSEFLVKLVHFVTGLNYHFADQISPVCSYNTRWELEFGVRKNQINVIYNGVDATVFKPKEKATSKKDITVVSLARIDPIKDIEMLIKSAEIVCKERKNVKFVVYGSISVQTYYEKCLKLVDDLGLKSNFTFAGHTTDVVSAYLSGDIVALSSISEAFPYSVIEAMMCEKPVVATDVGGVSEAIGDTGILVMPKDYEAFAEGIIKLADNPDLRLELGAEGRNRAVTLFSIRKMMEHHMKSYITLSVRPNKQPVKIDYHERNILVFVEIAEALFDTGLYQQAIEKYQKVLTFNPSNILVPYLMEKLALSYKNVGMVELAENTRKKADIFNKVMNRVVVSQE